MIAKKTKGFSGMADLEGIGKDVDAAIKPARNIKAIGRPKMNPHAEDKKLCIRIPEDIHKRLKMAGVLQEKPMVELAVNALIEYLERYEGKP